MVNSNFQWLPENSATCTLYLPFISSFYQSSYQAQYCYEALLTIRFSGGASFCCIRKRGCCWLVVVACVRHFSSRCVAQAAALVSARPTGGRSPFSSRIKVSFRYTHIISSEYLNLYICCNTKAMSAIVDRCLWTLFGHIQWWSADGPTYLSIF